MYITIVHITLSQTRRPAGSGRPLALAAKLLRTTVEGSATSTRSTKVVGGIIHGLLLSHEIARHGTYLRWQEISQTDIGFIGDKLCPNVQVGSSG